MCGIVGVLDPSNAYPPEVRRAIAARMLSRLEHRGPDSVGFAEVENGILGACRLSILGLESASDQPVRSPDSSCLIVYNGEIFNYLELRTELSTLGHTFRSSGDTEVLVHAYEEWGTDCLHRLNGMFAFAIYDGEKHRVFFARDRFGIKPFYYAHVGSVFVFGSEPAAVLESGTVSLSLDPHVVKDYLRFGITDCGEDTFFQAIKQLRPGWSGVIDDGGLHLERWYELPTTAGRFSTNVEPSALATQFGELLRDSVAIRMRSDVKVGLLLSGGLDSTSILAACGSLGLVDGLKAFCVSFPNSREDELQFAQMAASASGIPLAEVRSAAPTRGDLQRCFASLGEPSTSPSVFAQWLVMRAVASSGYRVLLTGQGADEWLGGYEYFDAFAVLSYLVRGNWAAVLRHLLADQTAFRLPSILLEVLYVAAPGSVRAVRWRKPWIRRREQESDACDYSRELRRVRTLRESLVFHLNMRLPQLLRYEDRNSMSFSIETRHPFIDHRMIELALSGPEEVLVGEGERKRLLRMAMEGKIPRPILARRRKIGFQTPSAWVESREFRSMLQEGIQKAPAELHALIDFDKVGHLLRRAPRGRQAHDLWRILNLVEWYATLLATYGTSVSGKGGERALLSGGLSTDREPPLIVIPTSADWAHPGGGGGMETFVRLFAEAAAARGVDVEIPAVGNEETHGEHVHQRPIMRSAKSEFEYVRRLRDALRTGEFRLREDAVILAGAEHYAVPFLKCRNPLVLVSHGSVPRTLRMRHGRLYTAAYRRFIERPVVRRADLIVSVSPTVTEYYKKAYPELDPARLVEIRVGVNLREFEGRPRRPPSQAFGLSEAAPVLLFVGRLSPEKNVRLLIQACDELTASGLRFQLVIVGDGPESVDVKEAAKNRSFIHWIPRVTHDDVLDMMAVSKGLVMCSSYESGPIVLLEAIASGLPVVSTDVGRASELVTGETGKIVAPDSKALAAAVKEMLERDAPTTRGLRPDLVKKIDFAETARGILALLADVRGRR